MKKLRNQTGLTLMEMLCAVIVLLLVTSLLALGVRFAVKSYQTSMAESQAQTLCATLNTAIADKLRYCGNVNESGGTIFIQDIGAVSDNGKGEFFHTNDAGEIVLDDAGQKKLLGSKAYPRGLRVDDLHVTYAEGVFHVSLAVTDAGGQRLAQSAFDVKRINHRE